MTDLGFIPLKLVQQCFIQFDKVELVMILHQIVDHFKVAGINDYVTNFVEEVNQRVELGNIVHGHGTFLLFGM